MPRTKPAPAPALIFFSIQKPDGSRVIGVAIELPPPEAPIDVEALSVRERRLPRAA